MPLRRTKPKQILSRSSFLLRRGSDSTDSLETSQKNISEVGFKYCLNEGILHGFPFSISALT